jgi:lipoyl-dependent peroxiredoxin subunit D
MDVVIIRWIDKPYGGIYLSPQPLWSLAVSANNGCGECIDAHDQVLRKAGVAREAIQQAVRIASVIHAVAVTLDGETSLAA